MRRRRGWYVIWPDDTTWFGDCPNWLAKCIRYRVPGQRIVPIVIVGRRRSTCECH